MLGYISNLVSSVYSLFLFFHIFFKTGPNQTGVYPTKTPFTLQHIYTHSDRTLKYVKSAILIISSNFGVFVNDQLTVFDP